MARTKKTETDAENKNKSASKSKSSKKSTSKKAESQPEQQQKKGFWAKLSTAARIGLIAGAVIILAVAAVFIVFARAKVPDQSMEGTLKQGETIIFNKFSMPEQGEIVIFRNPETDTIVPGHTDKNYYKMCRKYGKNWISKAELAPLKLKKRPVMVSRCIAGPNELVEIKDNKVFVNKKQIADPENIKRLYFVVKEGIVNAASLDSIGLTKNDIEGEKENIDDYMAFYRQKNTQNGNMSLYSLSNDAAEKFGEFSVVKHIEPAIFPVGHFDPIVFPYAEMGKKSWNESNFGALRIPAKGMKLNLSPYSVQLYRRAIEAYEGNTLEIKPDGFYINGKHTESYVFKQDYWFVMGDNRASKNDSRYFGLVPEDHILGTAIK